MQGRAGYPAINGHAFGLFVLDGDLFPGDGQMIFPNGSLTEGGRKNLQKEQYNHGF
jgi:hypothetical protein